MTLARIFSASSLFIALAACGGGDIGVRNGPQEVHPSPSALAQGVAVAPAVTTDCGAHGHHCHPHTHHHGANDGSQPIID